MQDQIEHSHAVANALARRYACVQDKIKKFTMIIQAREALNSLKSEGIELPVIKKPRKSKEAEVRIEEPQEGDIDMEHNIAPGPPHAEVGGQVLGGAVGQVVVARRRPPLFELEKSHNEGRPRPPPFF